MLTKQAGISTNKESTNIDKYYYTRVLEILNLSQKGEIDPWDVQVIEVIDRFLSELGLADETESAYSEADLPQSGQAFLWASMLVLLKADTLESIEEAEEEAELAEFDGIQEEESQRALPVRLERHIRRRSSAPPSGRRRVTLQEFIEQIEQIAAELEEGPSRSRSGRPRPQSRREAARVITQLAHNENLTEVATQLEQFLMFHLPQLSPEETWVDLDQLLEWWTDAAFSPHILEQLPDNPKSNDRVGVFWALLLLCAQSKVELWQTEFYQDLKIRLI
ncbi:MAG: segregation/condensation protein A [Xenococcaceae cyanobacterium]